MQGAAKLRATLPGWLARRRAVHTHFSTAGSFRVVFRPSRLARVISSRHSVRLYCPPLPLLCRPKCHPGQLAVRGSRVSSTCQTQADLGYGVSGFGSRIRFTAHAAFALRCSIASGYRPEAFTDSSRSRAHIQGSLLACRTLTGSYRLKLSRDPRISARCRAVQVSPHAPVALLRPHQPTWQDWVAPFISERPPVRICTASR